jgi:arylsulfatase A-like enzyme
MISIDTGRRDHFSCMEDSWVRSPRLQEFSRSCVLFLDHTTPATTTLPSHTSLLTGKYPIHHGVPRNGFMVNRENVMLPEILQTAGFHTAGFLGSFALDRRFDFAQGFDTFDERFDLLAGPLGMDQNQRRATAVTGAVIDYLEQKGIPPNLFLFVHYFDPHQPYAAPPPYNALYAERAPEAPGRPSDAGGLPPELRYAQEITYADAEIGRLLDYLARKGILDEAVLSVSSDHGENLGDEPRGKPFDHGWTVYEGEIRVPWMVRLPGGTGGGTTCAVPTSHIDVLPTLTKLLDLPAPTGIDGTALDLPRIGDPARRVLFCEASKPLFSEAPKPSKGAETDPHWLNARKARCARDGRSKYIETAFIRKEELYDLAADPHERRNLLVQPEAAATETAGRLREALRIFTGAARPLSSRFEPSQERETIERLKSLGYL